MPTLRIDNLFARRSIRKYTSEPVTDVQVETLLRAAMAAPSASDRKPWHFVVVRDAATRAALAEAHPHAKMLTQSPVCIVPCGDTSIAPDFWVQDLCAATENISGPPAWGWARYGAACTLGRSRREVRQVLGIIRGVNPLWPHRRGAPGRAEGTATQ